MNIPWMQYNIPGFRHFADRLPTPILSAGIMGRIKDLIVTLSEPTLFTASAVSLPGTSGNGNDGTITVTAGGGTPVYQYSIDNGTTYQPGTSFTVSGGSYPNIKVKDANNCEANTNVTNVLIDNMFLTLGADSTICGIHCQV